MAYSPFVCVCVCVCVCMCINLRVLTEQGGGYREQVSVAAVEDASEVLSQLQMLDLILPDGDVSGPERWTQNTTWASCFHPDSTGDETHSKMRV